MARSLLTTVIAFLLGAGAAFAQHDAALAARGEKVYAAQKCAVCHSVAGKGNQKGALDGVGSKLSADEIRMWIVSAPEMATKTKATRKPLMKAYTTLPKDELEALVVYLQSLKKK
jgi:mono/diheme cytochrome c family protein